MLIKLFKKTLSSVFFIIGIHYSAIIFAENCPTPQLSKLHTDTVKWVPDGDTIHTEKGHKVRLLHINTPEINPKSHKPPQAFAIQAQKKLQQLIGQSQRIYWQFDQRKKDKHGRELALVFNQQGDFLNAKLVEQGLAHRLFILPNHTFWQCITNAENRARKNKLGIWSLSQNSPKSPSQLKPNHGFQLIQGQVTTIEQTRNNRWLVLDKRLWVGIPIQNMQWFTGKQFDIQVGTTISLWGYVYESHGKLRVKLKHPAMFVAHEKDKDNQ